MNTIRMFFWDQEGRVRWGYKFLTLVLILELLLPVLLLFVSGFGLAVSLPALRERGIVDAAGILAEEYRETAEEVWTLCALSIQNLLLTGLCLLFGRLLLKKMPGQLGFRGGLALGAKELGLGLALGTGLLLAAALLIILFGGARIEVSGQENLSLWLLGYLVLFMLVGLGEETAFRGYAIASMAQTENPTLICCFTGLIFGLAHSANSSFSMMGFVNISLVGILLALLALKTGRLWMAIGFHIAWNFVQGCIVGFTVSGMETKSLFIMENTGSALISGGGFGAEGSILTTVVLAAALGAAVLGRKGLPHEPEKSF